MLAHLILTSMQERSISHVLQLWKQKLGGIKWLLWNHTAGKWEVFQFQAQCSFLYIFPVVDELTWNPAFWQQEEVSHQMQVRWEKFRSRCSPAQASLDFAPASSNLQCSPNQNQLSKRENSEIQMLIHTHAEINCNNLNYQPVYNFTLEVTKALNKRNSIWVSGRHQVCGSRARIPTVLAMSIYVN